MKTSLLSKSILLIVLLFVMNYTQALAQQGVAINPTGAPADSSAILDLTSHSKGILIPRLTETERNAITNPAEGLQIFNTTTKCLQIYIMNVWQSIYCGCSSAPATPGTIAGNTSICSGQSGVVYTISPVSGATSYTWSVPSGAVISTGQGTNTITVIFGSQSGNVSVIAANSCGNSGASSLAITVTAAPATPGAISGPTGVNGGQTGVVYSISAVTGATSYHWTVPSGSSITAGQGTTSITVTFGANSGNICVAGINTCDTGSSNCSAITVTGCPPGSQTFNYTGSLQTFTVPSCVNSITVTALGAQGGGTYGGNGGRAIATIVVIPNEVLNVYVGGRPTLQQGPGGYNGGGAITALPCGGPNDGFPGGGASDVRRGTPLANRLIVAGGGGGQGYSNGVGGSGGGLSGTDGQGSWIAGTQGLAGTQLAGGAGGYYSGNGQSAPSGSLGQGGDGGPTSGYCIGGAGGGGYYGGGGGYVSAGGGGSSFVAYTGNTNTSTATGVNTGNGQITINW